MITIHEANSKNFNTLGLGALSPTSCTVTEELNGQYELTLEHPYDDEGKWKRIARGNVICASTPNGVQPFRIYHVAPNMDKIKVNARHIFYDLLDNLCLPIKWTGNAAGALQAIENAMMYPMPFSFSTNILSTSVLNIAGGNPVQALLADEGSFVNAYGGEILRDGYDVQIWDSIGTDRGVTVRYGKNLTGLEVTEDYSEVKTRVVAHRPEMITKIPVGGDDYKYITLPAVTVTLDSESINDYPFPKIHYVEYSEPIYEVEVQRRAQEILDSGIDTPSVNIKVDFVTLANTVEYEWYASLEKVMIGDVVTVIHSGIGFSKKSKVISYSWDCLLSQYNSIELGDFAPSLTASISGGSNAVQTAEGASTEVKQIMSLLSSNITITGDALYICIDSPVFAEAQKLFKWGINGLEYSSTGIDGTWQTVINSDGQIVGG